MVGSTNEKVGGSAGDAEHKLEGKLSLHSCQIGTKLELCLVHGASVIVG